MPFCYETIDSPERRSELDRLELVSPLDGSVLDVTRWWVDRQRGLYFIAFGGNPGRDISYIFGLANKHGLLLEAHALEESVGERHLKNIDVTWKVSMISIPKQHAADVDILLAQLRDALMAYGSLGNVEVTKSVKVEFPAPQFIYLNGRMLRQRRVRDWPLG